MTHAGTEPLDSSPQRPMTPEEIRAAVDGANVPALLMVVYQFTGDDKWLSPHYAPKRGKGLGNHDAGGLPIERQNEIRDAAASAIAALQTGVEPAVPVLTPSQAVTLVSLFLGEHVDERYGPLLAGELRRRSATGTDVVEAAPVKAPSGFRVVVIGLGVAGIVGAHYLQQMGLEYTLYERNADAGGVWLENTYPGAGVDTPSHLYSFSFFDRDWQRHFELRDELHAYFRDAVDQLGIDRRVRYGHEVISATLDETTLKWSIVVKKADGTVFTDIVDVVISAVGSLNKPKLPTVPGMDDFEGLQFHSSRWPKDLDVSGKRVAIVGAGASAMQIAPQIAPIADHVTIFQRSPQWIAPFDQFRVDIPDAQRRLLASVRLYHAWYWVRLFWQFGDKVIEALRVDPEWEHPARSVNARNDGHRAFFTKYVAQQLEGRPDLFEKALPDYPPFGKRILLDNGWYAALKRENVDLVVEAVTRVDPDGPVSSSGETHPADVIIWATGFNAAYFLDSLEVRGVDGTLLRDVWEEDNPKAYLGVSIPDFPNFFMLGGPHSFPGSGSFMYFMEVQARYLRDLITGMFDMGVAAIDTRQDVTQRYNEIVDEVHSRTVWTHPGFGTYYRNSKGRVIFVMPFLNLEYWEFTQRPDFENYTLRFGDGRVESGSDALQQAAV